MEKTLGTLSAKEFEELVEHTICCDHWLMRDLQISYLTCCLQYTNIIMYNIVFTKQASKTLRRMPKNVTRLIREKLDQIASAPYAKYNNVTKLQNQPGYRLRVGDWRVIYEIESGRLVILVLKIGPRGRIYQ